MNACKEKGLKHVGSQGYLIAYHVSALGAGRGKGASGKEARSLQRKRRRSRIQGMTSHIPIHMWHALYGSPT